MSLSEEDFEMIKNRGIFPHAHKFFYQKSVFCEQCSQKVNEYKSRFCHYKWDLADCIYLEREEARECEENKKYKQQYCPTQATEACMAACYSKNKN